MAASLPTRFLFDQITGGMVLATGVALTTAFYAYTRRGPPVQCKMCAGRGHWNCVICSGSGKLKPASMRMRATRKCPACVGKGKRLCRTCDGSGYDKKTMYIG